MNFFAVLSIRIGRVQECETFFASALDTLAHDHQIGTSCVAQRCNDGPDGKYLVGKQRWSFWLDAWEYPYHSQKTSAGGANEQDGQNDPYPWAAMHHGDANDERQDIPSTAPGSSPKKLMEEQQRDDSHTAYEVRKDHFACEKNGTAALVR